MEKEFDHVISTAEITALNHLSYKQVTISK